MYKFQQTLASLLQRTYPNRIGYSGGILTLARDRKQCKKLGAGKDRLDNADRFAMRGVL